MEKLYDLHLLVHPAHEFYIGVAETDTSNFAATDTCFYKNFLRRVEGYNEAYPIKNFIVTGPIEYAKRIAEDIKNIDLTDAQIVMYQEKKGI